MYAFMFGVGESGGLLLYVHNQHKYITNDVTASCKTAQHEHAKCAQITNAFAQKQRRPSDFVRSVSCGNNSPFPLDT